MKDVTDGLAELSLEDRVVQAVRKFEQKQQSNNKTWLEVQVKQCEASENQAQARDDLAKTLKFDSWASLASKHGISSPSEVLDVDVGQNDAGTRAPVPEAQRQEFLASLQKAINEVYDQNSPNYRGRKLPKDYQALLSIADGIHDTDLRGSGVCGIDGIQEASAAKMTADESEKLPWGAKLWQTGWEVSTGFVLGQKAHDQWLVYYYCQRREVTSTAPMRRGQGTIEDHERRWKWRLFYKEPRRFQHSFLDPMVFAGIPEWLEFYGNWWHREVVEYPAWAAKMTRDNEILHPDVDEQEDDTDSEE